MKKLILSILLFLIVNFAFSQKQRYSFSNTFDLINGKNKTVPFIVNNAEVPDFISKDYENKFNSIDSFPLFPGFPIEVPDFNHLSGIYCQMDSDNDLEIVYAIGQKIYA